MKSTAARHHKDSRTGDGSMPFEGDPPALTVDERGMICDCNRAIESLFGYRRSEVVWRHISMLLPQMEDFELLSHGQVNPRLQFLCRIGKSFDALDRSGEHFESMLFVNDLRNPGPMRLRVIVCAAESA